MIALTPERMDRVVLLGLQALIVGVPLLLGGVHDATLTLACPIVLGLLAITVWRRWQTATPQRAPGVAALAGFVLLALVTAAPLPPALIAWLAPATDTLYRWTLPGWPHDGGWSVWRSIAVDPFATWVEVLRFAIGFGVFAVIVAYPWSETPQGESGRTRAFRVLFLTLVAGGLLFALIAFVQEAAGNGQVLWIFPAELSRGRLAGPFVNPNHFAAWLEMILPAVAAYCVIVANRVRKRLVEAADTGRTVGVQSRRAWAAALIANQGRLWPPLVAFTGAVLLLAAHLATDSRGGRAALMAGLLVAALGVLARRGPQRVRLLVRRHAAVLVAGILVVGMASFVVVSDGAGDDSADGVAQEVDTDMGMRLAVAARGVSVFTDHLLLGTGLGTWVHAFRPYQEPPIEDGIWDHAHNDYLELAAETGVAGLALTVLFGVAVLRGMRRDRSAKDGAGQHAVARVGRRHRPTGGDALFEESDWRRALGDVPLLRWGLAGGVLAVLIHSFVDFGLRMPGNLVALMVVLGLLVLSGTPRPSSRRSLAPAALLVVLVLAAVGPLRNAFRGVTGTPPLSAETALESADVLLAEEDDAAGAATMARLAIDRAPANREAHEALAEALGAGDDGDASLRRAIALEPWAAETRDKLGLRLWARGLRDAAAAELEESMYRYPHLTTHAYLDPDSGIFPSASSGQLLRELVEGETLTTRLAMLDADMADAIERGLRRALESHPAGVEEGAVTGDVVTLLEARGRWQEAATALRAQGDQRLDDTESLARAARNYLKVQDYAAAEETLLTAITRTPEQGALYRKLAVDVYAKRGDFDMAETILAAGERNAIDLVPVYRGVTDVLTRRETTRPVTAAELLAATPPPAEGDAADEDDE